MNYFVPSRFSKACSSWLEEPCDGVKTEKFSGDNLLGMHSLILLLKKKHEVDVLKFSYWSIK
jgi:hypothetical protein